MKLIHSAHICEVPIVCQALSTAVNKTKPWPSWRAHITEGAFVVEDGPHALEQDHLRLQKAS